MKKTPKFIIGGAMKSGTSTLRYIMSLHENVYIPENEINFFSIGDFVGHPFLSYNFTIQSEEEDLSTYWDQYRQSFEDATPDQVIGEDSTGYLSSKKAPTRIARSIPEVKLIFLLRDPVERAYSHYYHALQAGRAIYDFEDALQYGRRCYITLGLYKEQLQRYLGVFDRKSINILIFEDFIRNMQTRIDELCEWLGLSKSLNLSSLNSTRKNSSLVPHWPRLMQWQNYIFRSLQARNKTHRIAGIHEDEFSGVERLMNSVNYRLRYYNLHEGEKPPMSPEAESFLQDLYTRENRGLSELIGRNLKPYWPYMDQ